MNAFEVKVLILAGGLGSRLWPISTKKYPKQFLKIENEFSLLQNTLRRFLLITKPINIFIVTSNEYAGIAKMQALEIDTLFENQIIVEPKKKNTAFAITYALNVLKNKHIINDASSIIVSPIDHVFSSNTLFVNSIKEALNQFDPSYITAFGIPPSFPNPNFGYVKKERKISNNLFTSSSFIEKPDINLASKLMENNYIWNLGIYLFSYKSIKNYLKSINPTFFKILIGTYNELDSIPTISIDFALISKLEELRVFELPSLLWLDIGTLESLSEFTLSKDLFKHSFENSLLS
jgi:mannose-1-phosphate guanylyltransferase/mannose-6-phosphate isomerase